MKYADGSIARLGDIVSIQLFDGPHEGKIVMLGDTLEHLNLDSEFVKWVVSERLIEKDFVAIQWTGKNPLEHHDPNFAPVGDILFTGLDESIRKGSGDDY